MRFELDEIIALMDKVEEAGFDAFEYEEDDMKLKIRGKQNDLQLHPVENEEKEECRAKKNSSRKWVKKDPDRMKKPDIEIQTIDESSEKEGDSANMDAAVLQYVEAPLVGTFYHAPAEGADPFVTTGSPVKKGQIIGIIEAMKLMNEIQSEVDGIVEEILVPNETLVEYGQKLISVK